MKIVLTCGHPFAGFEWAHQLLARNGLSQLLPTIDKHVTATELRERISAALGFPQDSLSNSTQLTPGAEWRVIAEQILSANLRHSDCGWSDGGSVCLLEFWKSMSPDIRFILVYSSPEFAVGRMLLEQRNALDAVEMAASTWTAINTEMLRFYYRNPDRCLLVNVSAIVQVPSSFIGMTADTFGLTLAAPGAEAPIDHAGFPFVASSLAKALIEDRDDAKAVYREMESAAAINALDSAALNNEKHQAWLEYIELLSRLNETAKTDELLREKELLLLQLHQAQDELEQSTLKSKELAAARLQLNELAVKLSEVQASGIQQTEIDQLQAKHANLSQENEFLLVQLQQTQEELERFFLQTQELSRQERDQVHKLSAQASLWRNSQASEVIYDLSHAIEGENWYPPEAEGSWAGPGDISSVKILPLGIGQYELQLDVADAMAQEIVHDMEVFLNGTLLPVGKDCESYPAIIIAQFSTGAFTEAPSWEFKFKFPYLVSPSQRGADDSRLLAIRLRTLTIRKL